VPALRDNADNTNAIALMAALPTTVAGQPVTYPVVLNGRTLYKDGAWNTLCLPFNVTLAGSPLEGADVRALDNANLTDGTLTLNFTAENAITELVAGTPYIIKWTKADGYVDDDEHNIVNPVFSGVIIDATDRKFTSTDGKVVFKGNYDVQSFNTDNQSILFMGAGNTLYWPQYGATIGACRAYFEVAGGANSIKAFNLNFSDDATGIGEVEANSSLFTLHSSLSEWYTIDGRKLNAQPTQKGLYIHGGKKVAIK